MSDLKFTCSSCGQHIQCDEDYANERIPCPSCGSVVRVPADAPIVTDMPTPKTVSSTPATAQALAVPTLEDNFLQQESGAPAPSAPPITEREQQLAAARAGRPVVPATVLKPRLSYILNGGEAPGREENESAMHPQHKNPEESSPAKSLHE